MKIVVLTLFVICNFEVVIYGSSLFVIIRDVMPKTSKQIPIGGIIDKPGSSKEYKTGSWRSSKPVREAKRCIHCNFCAIYCPENCIPVKAGKVGDADLKYCKGCGICAEVCPVKCIRMDKS